MLGRLRLDEPPRSSNTRQGIRYLFESIHYSFQAIFSAVATFVSSIWKGWCQYYCVTLLLVGESQDYGQPYHSITARNVRVLWTIMSGTITNYDRKLWSLSLYTSAYCKTATRNDDQPGDGTFANRIKEL